MTLTTTPGAVDADSYASLTEANTYFTARGIATWTGSDTVKENALRRAAQYLDNTYRTFWIGLRYLEVQALAWPRLGGTRQWTDGARLSTLFDADGFQIDYTTVPTAVKNAQIEAALLILVGTNLEATRERGGAIKSIDKSVGPLRKSIVYDNGASPVDRYPAIEGYLRPLVTTMPGSSSGTIKLIRG